MIFYRTAEDFTVLYWEKPEDAGKYTVYRVAGENGFSQDVPFTHVTVTGLTADSCYRFTVQYNAGPGEGERDFWKILGSVTVRTDREKEKLDVTKAPFHASGDGSTTDTKALQAALDACRPDQIVFIPAGVYKTGALDVHSDTDICLEKGAVLQGTKDPADYLPLIPSRFEGLERLCYRSLINIGKLDRTAGVTCRNVRIYGEGKILSGGVELAKAQARTERERIASVIEKTDVAAEGLENAGTLPGRVRGRLINVSCAEHIWIHGITAGMAPAWNLHFIYSRDIVTDACTILSSGVWNGDGWDPDSSSDCTIFDTTFFTEDDSVAIKSGKNPEGNRIGIPSSHIRIFDCRCSLGHGLCIGSEMSGGVEDVSIWDCDMRRTWAGIEVKGCPKRGGYVRGLSVRDCSVSHISVHDAVVNMDGEGAPDMPFFSNFTFRDLHILGRYFDNNGGRNEWVNCPAIELIGFDKKGHSITDVSVDNVEIEEPVKTRVPAGTTMSPTGMTVSPMEVYAGNILISHTQGVNMRNVRTVPAEEVPSPVVRDDCQ